MTLRARQSLLGGQPSAYGLGERLEAELVAELRRIVVRRERGHGDSEHARTREEVTCRSDDY